MDKRERLRSILCDINHIIAPKRVEVPEGVSTLCTPKWRGKGSCLASRSKVGKGKISLEQKWVVSAEGVD